MGSSKTLIIILTAGVLLIVGTIIFKELSNKNKEIITDQPKVIYETLDEYVKNHLVTELERNSFYKVLTYKEDDIKYYALVDNNDKFIEKFNSSYTYKLYNFTYIDDYIESKWYCELSNDICKLKYNGQIIKENIKYDNVSVNNEETLKIKTLNKDNKLNYSYYNINDGKYNSDLTFDYLFKLNDVDLFSNKAIANKKDLGFILIDLNNLEPLTDYYVKIGYNYSLDVYTNMNYNYLIIVDNNDKYGVIDLNGNVIIDPIYTNLNIVSDGYFSYKENDKIILIDKNNEIIDKDISYILDNNDNYMMIIKNDNYKIYNKSMEELDLTTIFKEEKYVNSMSEFYTKYLTFSIMPYTKEETVTNDTNLYISKDGIIPFTEEIEGRNLNRVINENEYVGRFYYNEEDKIYIFYELNKKIVDVTTESSTQ